MTEVSPKNARSEFQRRRLTLHVAWAVAFIAGVLNAGFIAVTNLHFLLQLLAVIGVPFILLVPIDYLRRNGLPHLSMHCPYCARYIGSDLDWRCGHCQYDNRNPKLYPFIFQCEDCERKPKAYICHHCSESVFLDNDNDSTFPAVILNSARIPSTQDALEKRRQALAQERENKEHAIALARLDAELAMEQAKLSPPEKKNAKKILEEDLEDYRTRFIGAEELAQNEMRRAEVVYKDNPDMLERHRELIMRWRDARLE